MSNLSLSSSDHADRHASEACDYCDQLMYYVDPDDVADGSPEPVGWHVKFGDDGRCAKSPDGWHLCSYGNPVV